MALRLTYNKWIRATIGVGTGVLAGIVVGFLTKLWELLPLVMWDGIAASLLVMYWIDFHRRNAKSTEQIARKDNMGHGVLDIILTFASLVSIGAVFLMLAAADRGFVYVLFGICSIVLSWALVHAMYALRYAVMYYDNHDDGIDFSSKGAPSFIDFAYVAYTVGMTYQVSDTTFTSTRFRRVALGHALLSFVFGVAIIATTINFIAGLGK